MKSIFRILVLIGIVIMISLQLYQNRKTTNAIVQGAERELQAVPVKVFTAEAQKPSLSIRTAGKVAADSEVMVISQADGKLTGVNVRSGQTVKQGQVIASVDAYYIRQELELAKKSYDKLSKDLERYSNLSSENAISGQQMEQLVLQKESAQTRVEILERRLSHTSITAPINGVINQLFVKQGQTIGAGTPVAEIVNKDLLVIKTTVFRDDVDLLEPGMPVIVSSRFGNLDAVVSGVSVKPDHTGKYPVEISPESASEILKPGMVVNLECMAELGERIIIPERSLVNRDGKEGIFLMDEGKAVFREVHTGNYYDRDVEILAGVNAGDQIIISGNNFVSDNEPVKVVE